MCTTSSGMTSVVSLGHKTHRRPFRSNGRVSVCGESHRARYGVSRVLTAGLSGHALLRERSTSPSSSGTPYSSTCSSECFCKRRSAKTTLRTTILLNARICPWIFNFRYDNDDKEMDFEEFTMVINKLSTGESFSPDCNCCSSSGLILRTARGRQQVHS